MNAVYLDKYKKLSPINDTTLKVKDPSRIEVQDNYYPRKDQKITG